MISFSFVDQSSIGLNRHPLPVAYEDIPIPAGTVVPLNQRLVEQCVGALVKFEGGPFRQRMDGGVPVINATPANASGYLRSDGDEFFYSRDESLFFAVVLDTTNGATTGILRVTYYA